MPAIRTLPRSVRRTHTGVSLVEVLVALLVLSIGLLGLANLQLTAIRNAHSAHMRSQASILAQDILDRIRANRANATAYNIALSDAAPTGASVAEKDLKAWLDSLASSLPQGDGAVAVTAGSPTTVTVTIQWNDSRGLDGAAAKTWTYTTEL
ncbi:MAG TPA: type IV pilus modification protein PilV [Rhodospirillales bacterium]|nr:type IV pilus modification protein PilV [Rhodospirillales bacterium]